MESRARERGPVSDLIYNQRKVSRLQATAGHFAKLLNADLDLKRSIAFREWYPTYSSKSQREKLNINNTGVCWTKMVSVETGVTTRKVVCKSKRKRIDVAHVCVHFRFHPLM